MDVDQPKLCPILEAFEEYFGEDADCKKWPEIFLKNITKQTIPWRKNFIGMQRRTWPLSKL